MRRTTILAICACLPASALAADDTTTKADTEAAAKKAEEELRGLKLDNDEKARKLGESKRKEILDAFPSGDTTGKVDVKGSAGLVEAQGLTALAINGLAKKIASDVLKAASWSETHAPPAPAAAPVAPCSLFPTIAPIVPPAAPLGGNGGTPPAPTATIPVLLITGSQSLTFAHFDQFRFRACAIEKDYLAASAAANKALIKNPAPAAAGSLLGVGTALSAGVQLLKLVTPDWEHGSIDVKPSDRSLGMAVAGAYIAGSGSSSEMRPIYWQDASAKLGGSNAVFGALAKLDDLDGKMKTQIADLTKRVEAAQKAYDAAAKKKGADTKVQKQALADWTALLAADAAASAGYAQLFAAMNGQTGAATLPVDQVVTEAATALLLGDKGLALSVAVENAAGGYYTRRVVWNVFDIGGAPFFAAGGATVNFGVVRPADQRLVGAGLYSCHGGYTRVSKVAARLNSVSTTTCTATGR